MTPAAAPETAPLPRLHRLVGWLPPEPAPGPIAHSPALAAYVGALAAGALATAVATVRPGASPALLAIGGCATLLLAATGVRALSGVESSWSASVFAELGLTLAAGPMGALVAVAAAAAGNQGRFRAGWFRGVFNASNHLLSSLAAWAVFRAVAGTRTEIAVGILAGLAAGATSWLVNIGLLAGVQRLTQPGLRVPAYVVQNAGAVLPYHLGAGLTAFGGVVLVGTDGAAGFLLLLVPVLLLQMSLLVLASRTHAAQLQREAHTRERELLLRQALEASDAERHRIARNLHDGVVQDLAAIARGLRTRAERGEGRDGMSMRSAADATVEAIDELRTLLREIAPPDLEEMGLAAALAELAEPLRAAGMEVTVAVSPAAARIRGAPLAATYRIAQEAFRNVAQHARARHLRVAVGSGDGHLELEIADDGVGSSSERRHQRAEAGHLGLRLIRDLARRSGGELEIQSVPDAGTTLHARLPIEDEGARRRQRPRRGAGRGEPASSEEQGAGQRAGV